MNKEENKICPKCNWWIRFCHCKELEIFNCSKDKLWEFTDYKSTLKPVEIRSKGQWKRHLKKHNLIDDVEQKPKVVEEFHSREEIRNTIRENLIKKGLYRENSVKALKEFMKGGARK